MQRRFRFFRILPQIPYIILDMDEDEALAQEFLDVFCKVANTSVEEAGRPEGVLMKRNV